MPSRPRSIVSPFPGPGRRGAPVDVTDEKGSPVRARYRSVRCSGQPEPGRAPSNWLAVGPPDPGAPGSWTADSDGQDVDQLAALARAELDHTIAHGEQRVVAPPAHVHPRVEVGAPLADQDRAGLDSRAIEGLHPEALGPRVTAVSGGTATFG